MTRPDSSRGTSVAAIIVTRGDHDEGIRQITASLPEEWEVFVWDNGREALYQGRDEGRYWNVQDLSVYGRYAAIQYTDADLIYVQDDDCVVSDPAAIVREWKRVWREGIQGKAGTLQFHVEAGGHVVCNMPPEFRHDFYEDHALVGFGACFHRDAPFRAFARIADALPHAGEEDWLRGLETPLFRRTCDIVFTALTPRVLVDVPVENLPYAYHYDRMYRQPEHMAERARMRELAAEVRDAA